MMKNMIFASLAAVAVIASAPVHAAKTVGNVIDDATVSASVKAALLEDKNTHATKIDVDTYKGIVQLSGFVSSEAEKAEASRVAEGVSGVKEVRNSIAVHSNTSVGRKVDDSMLTGKVKAALIDAADVKSGQIDVESKGGVVQLAGFVNSESMKDRAGKVASSVSGVKRVDNELQVKPE